MPNYKYAISVEAKIKKDTVQKQLDQVAAQQKPTLKTIAKVVADEKSIKQYTDRVSSMIQKTVANREKAEAQLAATQQKYANEYNSSLQKREMAVKRIVEMEVRADQQKQERLARYIDAQKVAANARIANSVTGKSARSSAVAMESAFAEIDRQNIAANASFFGQNLSGKSAAASADVFNQNLANFRRYGEITTAIDKTTGQLDDKQAKLLGTFGRLNNEVPKGTKSFKTFGEILKNNIAKFGEWMIAGTLIMQAFRQLQAMVRYIAEVDKAMTNLRIITGMNEESARDLIKSYNQLGKEIGATTMEIASGAEEWLRAGKTAEESLLLVRQSLTLSKLANMSAADSTQALISALNGYKLAATEASSVIDKLIAVDNAAATSAQELATAMSYTAATAELSGVSMNKLIGLIGTVSSVTRRSAETIGTAFKSIFARMGNVKVGKFIDDDSGEAINDVEAVLSKVNISLRDSKDNFRDFESVIEDVANKWEDLSEIEQNALATAIAGTRQRETFIVAMENYDEVLRLTTEAQESAGLSALRMAEYTESFAGKSAKLQANLESLYSTMLDSSLLKGLVDLASLLIGVTNALGGWTVIIPTVIMLLSALQAKWAITINLIAFGTKIASLFAAGLTALASAIPALSGAITWLTAAFAKLGLSAAATAAIATGGLLLAFTLLPAAVDYFTTSLTELRQEAEKSKSALASLKTEYEQLLGKGERTDDEEAYLALLREELRVKTAIYEADQKALYKKIYGGGAGSSIAGLAGRGGEGEFTVQGQNPWDISVVKTDLSDIGDNKVMQKYLEIYRELKDMPDTIQLTAEQTEFLANMEGYLADEANNANFEVAEQLGDLDKLQNTYAKLKSSVSEVSDLYKEMSDSGEISIETVLGLIDSGSELLSLLYVENGVYKLNMSAARAYFNTKRDSAVADLRTQKAVVEAKILETKAIMKNIEALIAEGKLRGYGGGYAYVEAQKTLNSLNSSLTQINNSINVISKTTLPKYSGATQESSNAIENQIELLERQKDAALDAIDSQIDGLERQLDLLKEQNEETQNQIDLQTALADLERAKNQRNTRVYTSEGWNWVSDPSAVASAEKALSEVQQRIAEDAIQDKIDALERKKEDTAAGFDAKIKNLRGYSSGGMVDYTGPAMLHGRKGSEEYVSSPIETRVLRGMLSKMGGSPTSKFSSAGGGMAYNIYGDINVSAKDGDTLDSVLDSAISIAKTGR